jgi:hypothetical protein
MKNITLPPMLIFQGCDAVWACNTDIFTAPRTSELITHHHQWHHSPINEPWPLLDYFLSVEDSQQIFIYRVRLSA